MRIASAEVSSEKRMEDSPSGPVLVRPYQIIFRMSLELNGVLSADFPAILDTGHNLNFSISEEHLRNWAVMQLHTIGTAKVNNVQVDLRKANVAVHSRTPTILRLDEGIAVHDKMPRLPILGLRALVKNDIKLVVKARWAHLSKGWF
jgi:hypothetical protein